MVQFLKLDHLGVDDWKSHWGGGGESKNKFEQGKQKEKNACLKEQIRVETFQ